MIAPGGIRELRPSADGDWDWDWVALGWPKRGPRATQASRKGRRCVRLDKCFVCSKSSENGGGVGARRAYRRDRSGMTLGWERISALES
jgi:hypothetical protein